MRVSEINLIGLSMGIFYSIKKKGVSERVSERVSGRVRERV